MESKKNKSYHFRSTQNSLRWLLHDGSALHGKYTIYQHVSTSQHTSQTTLAVPAILLFNKRIRIQISQKHKGETSPVKVCHEEAEKSCCSSALHQFQQYLFISLRLHVTWLPLSVCHNERTHTQPRTLQKAKVYTHVSNWSFQDCLTVAWANLRCSVSGLKTGRRKGRKWQWCSAGSTKATRLRQISCVRPSGAADKSFTNHTLLWGIFNYTPMSTLWYKKSCDEEHHSARQVLLMFARLCLGKVKMTGYPSSWY